MRRESTSIPGNIQQFREYVAIFEDPDNENRMGKKMESDMETEGLQRHI